MTHGGKRPGAGRKKGSKNPNAGRQPGSLNRLTHRLHAEQMRTRESEPKLLLRILRQRRVRNHKLSVAEMVRLLKTAAPLCARPMGHVVVDAAAWNAMIEKARAAYDGDRALAKDLPALYRLAGAFTVGEQCTVRAAIGL